MTFPLSQQATIWFASVVLVVAAVIDGRSLRVPNWLTYSFAGLGLACSFGVSPVSPTNALLGLGLGLLLLLPLYAVGGMGAGDVKLLAGLGAWVGPALVLNAFVVSACVGAVMAIGMMAFSGSFKTHWARMKVIAVEWMTIRNPTVLAEIAAVRKPSMRLLPYGIPIAIGSVGYFAAMGLLI